MLIILIGPSGSGKSTIEKILVNQHGFDRIISHTTRKPRPGEIDGVDYYFVTPEQFNQIEMVERTEYNGNLYGASVQEFKIKASGDCVFVAELNGALQVKALYPKAKLVYLWVPERIRFQRMLETRGPVEARLRIQADRKVFAEAETIASIIAPNYPYKPEWVVKNLLKEIYLQDLQKNHQRKKDKQCCSM